MGFFQENHYFSGDLTICHKQLEDKINHLIALPLHWLQMNVCLCITQQHLLHLKIQAAG